MISLIEVIADFVHTLNLFPNLESIFIPIKEIILFMIIGLDLELVQVV